VQVERSSYISAIGSLFDVPYLLVFSVRLQVYLISFTNLESAILPVYLGDSLLANTEYTAGFYTF
jgi:hypothetical protein